MLWSKATKVGGPIWRLSIKHFLDLNLTDGLTTILALSPSQLRLCNVRVIFSMLIVSVDLIAFINIKTDFSLLNSEAKTSFVQINHRFAKFKLLDHPIIFTSTECFNQHLRKFTWNPTLKDNSLVFSNMLSSVTNKILSGAQIKSETFCVGIWMLSCHVKYC